MILIGVGSSMGDAEKIFSTAKILLRDRGVQVLKASKNYITEPFGGVAQNTFTNAVWAVETDQDPHELLSTLHRVEALCGRVRAERWGDRTLDLDILTYYEQVLNTPELTLPHPGIPHRGFVLQPMRDVVPVGYEIPLFGPVEDVWASFIGK